MRACLRKSDAWWLMFFYSVSFGGFVGLASFLPIYFHDQYRLSAVTAGYFTAGCVFAGSFARPVRRRARRPHRRHARAFGDLRRRRRDLAHGGQGRAARFRRARHRHRRR